MSYNGSIVSIIVPIYNAEKYLEECIQSLIEQTYSNIEILLVNDGSTDRSVDICNAFRNQDSRIKVFHIENEGVSNARNVGLTNARGEYVAFVDADDWVEVDYIESLVTGIQRNDADVYVEGYYYEQKKGVSEVNYFNQKTSFIGKNEKLKLINILVETSQKNSTFIGSTWGRLYRRKLIEKYEIVFPYGIKRAEDTIFNLYSFYHMDKIVFDNIAKYHYRKNETSAMHRFAPDFEQTAVMILDELQKFYEKYFPLKEEWKPVLYVRSIKLLIVYVKVFLANRQCNKCIKEKIVELQKIAVDFLCVEASEYKIIGLDRKYRLIQFLIRREHYPLLYALLVLNTHIEKRKLVM